MAAAMRAHVFMAVLMAMLAGCHRGAGPAQSPEEAANAFFADLQGGNPQAAYESTAFGFQAAQNYEAFIANARMLNLLAPPAPGWTAPQRTGDEAHLDAPIMDRAGTHLTLRATLHLEGGRWKLFSLETAEPDKGNELSNPFSLVGKGPDFNDVFHQPVPATADLIDLVHSTIAQFNSCVQNQDFAPLYKMISRQWRDGIQESGKLASPVTPSILKKHFQPFIDDKIDLSSVASLKPVFEKAPLVTPDGILELRGHFDPPEYRVSFLLEYAYELPRWKIFGINITLTTH